MLDDLKPYYDEILERFDAEDSAGASAILRELSPSDAADLLRSFQHEQKVQVLRLLPAADAANILSELDERSLPDLLELLEDEEIVGLLDTLDSDDAADVVGQMEDDQAHRVVDLLDQVDHQDALELEELLRYPEDTAGGVMAKEYLSVHQGQSLGSVAAAMRGMEEDDLVSHHYAFVVDGEGHLLGQIPLLKLLLSDPGAVALDLMEPDPLSVGVMEDQERVANLFRKHDLVSMPVVDDQDRLVGRITVDDAMEVMAEEATEDIARLVGTSEEEVGETSVMRISRARMPWLLVGLAGQLLAAVIMSRFEDDLRARVLLAFFIPMVMATGGNVGIQTSSIVIRLLATDEFDRFRAGRHLLREVLVGLFNGLVLGGLMMLVLHFWKGDATLGLVIGLALASVVFMAALFGSLVPLLLHKLGVDPALATGPFITTMNDVLGILVYLGLANWLLTKV